MKNIFISLTILYIAIALFFPPQVSSAAGFGLSINPPLLRVHIKPGKSITQVFKIENLGNSDRTLVASIVPFTEADDQGNPILNPKANATWLSYFGLANSQIKFNDPFTIAAGGSEQLILSLTIPSDAPLKDLYATLMVSTYENSLGQTFQGSSLRATIGSNLLITISSQAFPDTILRVENFSPIDGNIFKIGNLYFADSITPLKFTASVINDGSFTAETKGIFKVTTRKDTPVFLDGILPVNVIAKTKRQLVNATGENFQFIPSLSNIGTHHISLEIKTENSNTTSTINVFFFPLKLCLGLFVSLFIIFSIVKITAKSSGNMIDKH